MSLQQFNDFVAACRSTPFWAMACEKGHVNLYDVVTCLVKPWTRNTGCSIALRMNPKEVLQAEAWTGSTKGSKEFKGNTRISS